MWLEQQRTRRKTGEYESDEKSKEDSVARNAVNGVKHGNERDERRRGSNKKYKQMVKWRERKKAGEFMRREERDMHGRIKKHSSRMEETKKKGIRT